jgi:hypothetical protein
MKRTMNIIIALKAAWCNLSGLGNHKVNQSEKITSNYEYYDSCYIIRTSIETNPAVSLYLF